ncbi:hypothetical protein [Bhargavaea cecembensis]|uniref:hypothetical protein n=1 Tax=Bhargavaea cecembensis TaxID=394098 RepID=UPI00058C4B5E|nr:hypothetical protein [Bhargavaea cecembensis]
MLDYIFLVIGAVIVFPVIYYLMTKGKAGKSVAVMAAAGFFIALAGVYLQEHFAFYYAVLAMIGLAFAAGVLIDKRMGDAAVAEGVDEVIREPIRLGGEPEAAADEDEVPVITPAEVRAAILNEDEGTIEPIDAGPEAGDTAAEPTQLQVDDIPGMEEIVLPGTADIVRPPDFGEKPEDADPAEVVDAELDIEPSGFNDHGLDVIGKQDMPEFTKPDIDPDDDPAMLEDDDFIDPASFTTTPGEPNVQPPDEPADDLLDDNELEAWLSSRPEPEDVPAEEAAEDELPDSNPFDLLDDDDFIVEEEEDGKQ